MSRIDPELSRQIVQGFAGAFKGLRLYPLQHPAIERQIGSLLTAILSVLQDRREIRMGLLEGVLFVEQELYAARSLWAEEIGRLLQENGLEGLLFRAGIRDRDLQVLLGLLADPLIKGEDFGRRLQELGIENIRAIAFETHEEEQPRKVYGRALKVVECIFDDVRLGRIPSSTEAISVVKSLVHTTLTEPHALFALSMLKDYDQYTFTHSVNVSVIALAVGRACGASEERLRILGLGGLLHDLGKLKVDRLIINKPGRLTATELEEIMRHPAMGAELVEKMEGITPEVVEIVLCHHLRYNREGYPVEARPKNLTDLTYMAAIADTYDAMTTLRSYQRPLTPKRAIARLRELTGSFLHPAYVEPFIASLGTYPVGSLVRLDTNAIGLVVWVDTHDPDRVRLKILFDEEGHQLAVPRREELDGNPAPKIVTEVDPLSKAVEITQFLDF